MNKQDLLLISDDELLTELRSRYTASIFMGVKEKCGDRDNDAYNWDFSGNKALCLGLTEMIILRIKKEYENTLINNDNEKKE